MKRYKYILLFLVAVFLRSYIQANNYFNVNFNKRFEGTIPDIETQHKLDLLFENEDGLIRSIEVKNWANANNVGYNQFKAYIASGNEFRYYFNGTQETMKTQFQNVFLDQVKAQELWQDAMLKSPNFFSSRNINTFSEFQNQANQLNSSLYNFIR